MISLRDCAAKTLRVAAASPAGIENGRGVDSAAKAGKVGNASNAINDNIRASANRMRKATPRGNMVKDGVWLGHGEGVRHSRCGRPIFPLKDFSEIKRHVNRRSSAEPEETVIARAPPQTD